MSDDALWAHLEKIIAAGDFVLGKDKPEHETDRCYVSEQGGHCSCGAEGRRSDWRAVTAEVRAALIAIHATPVAASAVDAP